MCFWRIRKKQVAETCFNQWKRHLLPELIPDSKDNFSHQLERICKKGYALEYQEETSAILRLAVPVPEPSREPIRFAVGFVARNIYLLEVEDCLQILTRCAEELSGILGADN